MTNARLALSVLILAAGHNAWAGGSDAPVLVQSLEATGVNYTLVVVPQLGAGHDLYMGWGSCTKITVRGTYQNLAGLWLRQNALLSKAAHLKALDFLRSAAAKHQVVRLGSMGYGLVPVDTDESCVLSSRALLLLEDERGTAVYSFHNAI